MIHALLFVTANNRDHSAHGPEFLHHMRRINALAGTRVSVFHSFHDEVDVYRQHWWQCSGPCSNRPPYFGLVKRAMNRAPSPHDYWWAEHQLTCGGSYAKVHEPARPPPRQPRRRQQQQQRDRASKSDGRAAAAVLTVVEAFQRANALRQPKLTAATDTCSAAAAAAGTSPAHGARLQCPACGRGGFADEAAVDVHLNACLS